MHQLMNIAYREMESQFVRILSDVGFSPLRAGRCAAIFAQNTLDGVASHGVARFSRFIRTIQSGHIQIHAEPTMTHRAGAIEQWNGNLGPGPLNALACTKRGTELAEQFGIGCVALAHTNHWMRGGYYAWQAVADGKIFIGWTNTTAIMPAWGAVDCRLGNNPLVIGIPHHQNAIVLDMAMSQYSYGTMELRRMRHEQLPYPGGYDHEGKLTTDPAEILSTSRALPIGYWKGSGLALLLDMLATILSGGLSTMEISKREVEHGISQIFILIDPTRLSNASLVTLSLDGIINDLHASMPESEIEKVLIPGERVLKTRQNHLRDGIPVDTAIWNEILSLVR